MKHRDGFVQIPNAVFDNLIEILVNHNIPAAYSVVFIYMIKSAFNDSFSTYLTRSTLINQTKLSASTIDRATKAFFKTGLLIPIEIRIGDNLLDGYSIKPFLSFFPKSYPNIEKTRTIPFKNEPKPIVSVDESDTVAHTIETEIKTENHVETFNDLPKEAKDYINTISNSIERKIGKL